MENWIVYALIAAFLIACRDMFTKDLMNKYTYTEHLLHYYILTGVFILIIVCYKKYVNKETVRIIDNKDILVYLLISFVTVAIISPCQVLSLKYCTSPEKSKAIVNINSIFIFILGIFIYKNYNFELSSIIGIILTIAGLYLVAK